ncbi:MAG: hypothetical protein ACI87E_002702 [Mariniblastus sp.]|jgi:hypothetical protein
MVVCTKLQLRAHQAIDEAWLAKNKKAEAPSTAASQDACRRLGLVRSGSSTLF